MRGGMPRTPMPRAAIIGISGYGKIYLERLLHHAARGELKIAAATVLNRSDGRAVLADWEGRGAVTYGDCDHMFRAQTARSSDRLMTVAAAIFRSPRAA